MPIRTAPETPRYDASPQRRADSLYEREPLLIPQLFDDAPPPWYRRRGGIVLGVVLLLCLVGLGVAVQQFGFRGTAERAGRGAVIVLRAFANAVS